MAGKVSACHFWRTDVRVGAFVHDGITHALAHRVACEFGSEATYYAGGLENDWAVSVATTKMFGPRNRIYLHLCRASQGVILMKKKFIPFSI